MPKHSRSKPKYGKIFVTIIERECKKELIRNKNSTAEEITELLLLNFRNQFRHRPSLLRNVDQTLKNIRQNISGGNDRLIKLQEEYVKNVESSTGSGLDFDNTTSDESDHSYSDSVFDVTKDMLRESYLNNRGIKKSGTVFAEERDDDAGYDKNEAKTEKGIEFNRKSKNDSTKKTFKRNYSTVETREDAVFNQKKAKMARSEEHVELEEVVNSVKNQKKKDLLWRNKKDISEEVRKGNPGGPMFKDLGGISEILKKIKSEIIFPLFNAELSRDLGITPIKGILLKGSPGCGKTTLVRAIANETGIPFYYIAATELVSGISGASEDNIRELFAKAYRTAPSIIFIDEIDAIGSKRDNQRREMETRIVAQLLACMDESNKAVESSNSDPNTSRKSDCVLVFGATNRPDALDAALRRAGRFEREITLNFPDEKARLEILSVLAKKLRVKGSLDLAKIARSTYAFVGADLKALINNAGRHAVERMRDSDWGENWWMRTLSTKEREPIHITMADLEEAVKLVQPSSTREGFSSIPNVKWEDVGGLPELRKEFNLFIIKPLKNPDNYVNVDLDFGFLLYGPPGCGKTLIAMAVANEAGANFIHIKAGELLNKYVGESERAVRTLFSRARTCSPCIIFFDEVDALTSNGDTEGGGVVDRLLRQLMIELSGSDDRRNVFIIGATNRPEVMDRALFRDGRFGKLIHVTLPNAEERGSILTALARKKNIDASVDLIAFGRDEACKNLSGSDLKALLNNAAMFAINEGDAVIASEEACKDLEGADTSKLLKKDVIVAVERQAAGSSISGGPSWPIKKKHLVLALKKICPTVSEERKQYYYFFEQSLKAACRDIRDGEKEDFVNQKSDPQNVDPKVVDLNDNDLPIIDNDTRPRRQQRNAPPPEPRRRASSSANMINGIGRTGEICEKMVNRSTSLEPQVTIKECMKILKEMEDEVPQTSPLYLFAIRLFYKQEHRDVFKELEPSMRVPWIANELTEAKKK